MFEVEEQHKFAAGVPHRATALEHIAEQVVQEVVGILADHIVEEEALKVSALNSTPLF